MYKASVKFHESRLGRKLTKPERQYLKSLADMHFSRGFMFARGSSKSFMEAYKTAKLYGEACKFVIIDEWINEEPPLRKE